MADAEKRVSALPAHVRTKVVHEAAKQAAHKSKPFECRLCHFEFSLGEGDPNIEVDHKVPVNRGGTNNLENLEAVCRSCNRSKNCYEEANPDRKTVARKVLCACGKAFYMDDASYARCLVLIQNALLPCSECRAAIAPPPSRPRKKRRDPGEGLPEGFEPAKSTLKKEGL